MNLVLAFVLLFVFFAAIGPQDTTRVVDQVDKNFPAAGRAASRATGWWRWTAIEATRVGSRTA